MTTSVFPTMSAAKMLFEVARFLGLKPELQAGVDLLEQIDFVKKFPDLLAVMDLVSQTPGVSLEAWADYTKPGLLAKLPSDIKIAVRDFKDLGVVSRQMIDTSWLQKGVDNFDGEQICVCGDKPAFMLSAYDFKAGVRCIEAFDAGDDFQTPVFKIKTVEGGHIYLAQHNNQLSGSALLRVATRMLASHKKLPIDQLVAPYVIHETREDLPWMTGIIGSGFWRVDYAHLYAKFKMDECGSSDHQEVQAGVSLGVSPTYLIEGPMVYCREIGGEGVSIYHFGMDAFRRE